MNSNHLAAVLKCILGLMRSRFRLLLEPWPNHTIQRMGASRLAQRQFRSRCRLAPTADGGS
jgi:hypothetical protein